METQAEALKQNWKPKIEDQRSGRPGAKQIHKVQKQNYLFLGGQF